MGGNLLAGKIVGGKNMFGEKFFGEKFAWGKKLEKNFVVKFFLGKKKI